jgi:hypothetical protein
MSFKYYGMGKPLPGMLGKSARQGPLGGRRQGNALNIMGKGKAIPQH